jgi:hypothetical protein
MSEATTQSASVFIWQAPLPLTTREFKFKKGPGTFNGQWTSKHWATVYLCDSLTEKRRSTRMLREYTHFTVSPST